MNYGKFCLSRQKRVKYTANATARHSHVVPWGLQFDVRAKKRKSECLYSNLNKPKSDEELKSYYFVFKMNSLEELWEAISF